MLEVRVRIVQLIRKAVQFSKIAATSYRNYHTSVTDEPSGVRIDKWLWAVRLFKTRSLASTACTAGHVRLGDRPVKPAREIRPGEVIRARANRINRTVKVLAVIDRRIAAKLVPDYLEDMTSPAEYEKARQQSQADGIPHRPKGTGRPTKKQRRQLKPFTG